MPPQPPRRRELAGVKGQCGGAGGLPRAGGRRALLGLLCGFELSLQPCRPRPCARDGCSAGLARGTGLTSLGTRQHFVKFKMSKRCHFWWSSPATAFHQKLQFLRFLSAEIIPGLTGWEQDSTVGFFTRLLPSLTISFLFFNGATKVLALLSSSLRCLGLS